MEGPLVSIGLPVYNGEKYLESALRSLVGQTYPHIEIIICDNRSEDLTEMICRKFAFRGSENPLLQERTNIRRKTKFQKSTRFVFRGIL